VTLRAFARIEPCAPHSSFDGWRVRCPRCPNIAVVAHLEWDAIVCGLCGVELHRFDRAQFGTRMLTSAWLLREAISEARGERVQASEALAYACGVLRGLAKEQARDGGPGWPLAEWHNSVLRVRRAEIVREYSSGACCEVVS